MKKFICLLALLFLSGISAFLQGSEVVLHKNRLVTSGGKEVYVFPNNNLRFSLRGGLCLYGHFYIGTRAGYYSYARVRNAISYPLPGVWSFKGDFPANKQGGVMQITSTVEHTPMGWLEMTSSWRSPEPADAKDMFYNFYAPIKLYQNKKVRINGKFYTIKNISKYGIFNAVIKDPEVTFYPGEPREIRISAVGRCRIVLSSTKGKEAQVRFYPVQGSSRVDLVVKFQ